jgi:hypothetical protein
MEVWGEGAESLFPPISIHVKTAGVLGPQVERKEAALWNTNNAPEAIRHNSSMLPHRVMWKNIVLLVFVIPLLYDTVSTDEVTQPLMKHGRVYETTIMDGCRKDRTLL